jgi:hypothetical protein
MLEFSDLLLKKGHCSEKIVSKRDEQLDRGAGLEPGDFS